MFKTNDKVYSKIFGEGIVIEINAGTTPKYPIIVEFKNSNKSLKYQNFTDDGEFIKNFKQDLVKFDQL